jgi:hypothetical protein
MTCGIYRLIFANTNKCYIGQSIHIEIRFLQHISNIKNGTATSKLMEAYNLYGLPKLDILVECYQEELDHEEEQSIDIFNSVENGFNTNTYVYQAPIKKGVESGNSKYSKNQILESLRLISTPGNSIIEASKLTGIGKDTITNILGRRSHLWVSEEFPDLLKKANTVLISTNTNNRIAYCKEKYTILAKQIKYPKVIDPLGNIHRVDNINEFSKVNGTISKSSLHRLLSGQTTKTKGWTVCQEELL